MIACFLIVGSALAQDTWKTWLNEGVRAFKSAHYSDAAVAVQKSVDINPSAVEPRLYLASAWMNQYIPGATMPENLETASNAERGFLVVLDLDPKNVTALDSLASLKYLESQGTQVLEDKLKLLDEARGWYLRLLEVDPAKQTAHYTLGVIDWTIWYPGWNAARMRAGMRPDQPGPIEDAAVRADLRSRYQATLKDGIDHLNQALAIDPKYDDAMAYMNLLLRESADLADSRDEYQKMTLEADQWVQQALDTRKKKAEESRPTTPGVFGAVGGDAGGGHRLAGQKSAGNEPAPPPTRITVPGGVMQSKLTAQPPANYPLGAKQAGIEGDVQLSVIIGKDGSVIQVDVKSGHPMLSPAAMEAVRHWKYKPTLLNREPVEVVTLIHLNFVLDNSK